MERFRFRSTSLIGLQGELRERDLLASVQPGRRAPIARPHRSRFGLLAAWRRSRGDERA